MSKTVLLLSTLAALAACFVVAVGVYLTRSPEGPHDRTHRTANSHEKGTNEREIARETSQPKVVTTEIAALVSQYEVEESLDEKLKRVVKLALEGDNTAALRLATAARGSKNFSLDEWIQFMSELPTIDYSTPKLVTTVSEILAPHLRGIDVIAHEKFHQFLRTQTLSSANELSLRASGIRDVYSLNKTTFLGRMCRPTEIPYMVLFADQLWSASKSAHDFLADLVADQARPVKESDLCLDVMLSFALAVVRQNHTPEEVARLAASNGVKYLRTIEVIASSEEYTPALRYQASLCRFDGKMDFAAVLSEIESSESLDAATKLRRYLTGKIFSAEQLIALSDGIVATTSPLKRSYLFTFGVTPAFKATRFSPEVYRDHLLGIWKEITGNEKISERTLALIYLFSAISEAYFQSYLSDFEQGGGEPPLNLVDANSAKELRRVLRELDGFAATERNIDVEQINFYKALFAHRLDYPDRTSTYESLLKLNSLETDLFGRYIHCRQFLSCLPSCTANLSKPEALDGIKRVLEETVLGVGERLSNHENPVVDRESVRSLHYDVLCILTTQLRSNVLQGHLSDNFLRAVAVEIPDILDPDSHDNTELEGVRTQGSGLGDIRRASSILLELCN